MKLRLPMRRPFRTGSRLGSAPRRPQPLGAAAAAARLPAHRSAGAAGLVLLLALAGCRAEQAEEAAAEALPLVATEAVVALDLEDRILATGELRAPNHAELAAEVDGRVTGIHVEEGHAVEAGQPILELDPVRRKLELRAARARLSEAQANLREARRELERLRLLRRRDIASEAALEKAQTALQLAESRVQAASAEAQMAERALAEATVRAPFAGLVADRKVSLGEYVQRGQALVELVSLDPIEVVFHVAERDSGRVRVGQEVAVRVAPYPDERFMARVDVVSPMIDRRTRTLRVKATLPNADGRLRPGLFARADLGVARRAGVPVIPEEAVMQRTDGAVVFVMTPDRRVHRRRIAIGGFREGVVEVADGLRPGEEVVVRGQAQLVDGMRVRLPDRPLSAVAAQPGAGLRDEAATP